MDILSTPTTSHVALPGGQIRSESADFVVDEQLGFQPDGDGEHLWLQIRKKDMNTRDVAAELGGQLNLQERVVNYSGLKDKIAVTTQWFSVPWPIRSALPEFSTDTGWQVIEASRSRKRLRSGTHRSNRFQITIRQLKGDTDLFDQRVECVREKGFPNYFGPQRFGRGGGNIHQAQRLFAGKMKVSRFKKGLYLSAARSLLFNRVLAERVGLQNWDSVIEGEVLMLDGSNSRFNADDSLEILQARCDAFDIHPSGPLAGQGDVPVSGEAAALEMRCAEACGDLQAGLERAGLKHERRALRAIASGLQCQWLDAETAVLVFELPRGVYATSLLQELIEMRQSDIQ